MKRQLKHRKTMRKISAKNAANKISLPFEKWKGNCSYVCQLFLQFGLVKGEYCYGHYHGKIASTGIFANRPFSRHAWIKLPNGEVCDPTRWVFEDTKPYIYVGPNNGEYDYGGNRVKSCIVQKCPPFDFAAKGILLGLDGAALHFMMSIVNVPGPLVTFEQVMWLANLPIDSLSIYAKSIYKAIIDAGHGATIPMDNRVKVIEGGYKVKTRKV
jgi:hypothetical protein